MDSIGWKRRVGLFVQRFWQPTTACMSCMPGGLDRLWSQSHWVNALHTGLLTGILAVLLSFTVAAKLYQRRSGNALVMGCLTALGDFYSHASHYEIPLVEPLVTGVASGLLTLAGSYLLEDRARRVRSAWAFVRARLAH